MDHSHIQTVLRGGDGNAPITEADLHAYADELLPPQRRADVEAYLSRHPLARQRVESWREQNQALRQILAPVVDEPVPLRLSTVPARTTWPWRSIAAGVMLAVASGSGAWWLRGVVDGTAGVHMALGGGATQARHVTLAGFAQRAAVAHAVYAPDARRPVEVGADQEQALVTWLTKRMGAQVRPPDLRPLGYALMGGRLLPGDKAPVAQFMFEGQAGQRLTLYVTREDADRESAFRFGQDGPVNVFYWVDKDVGYAISSSEGRPELLKVAQAVFDQLKPR